VEASPPPAEPSAVISPAYLGDIPLSLPGCPGIDEIGLATVLLWLNSPRWIHRRAESMELEDANIGCRALQVSFTVPDDVPSFELDGRKWCCLPVSLLRKHKVDLFCLKDETGRELPLLARRTRGEVAAAGLVRAASGLINAALGSSLSADLEEDIRSAARARPAEAISVMRRMEGAPPVSDPVSAASRALLMGYEAFRLLMWSLALNSLVLVRIPYTPGHYQTLSARYDEPLNEMSPGSGFRRMVRAVFRTTGLTPKKLWFPARALASPSSNHYLITAPDGLQISAATLAVEELTPIGTQPAGAPASAAHLSVQERIGVSDTWEERDRETGSLSRIHMYDRELPQHAVALVRINLRPRAGGTLRAIWFTAALAVILLASTDAALGTLRSATDLSTAAQSASALLLLIPTLLAAYVARPGEHTLTSELLFGTRLLGLAAGATTFAAGAYLVLTDPSRKLGGNWSVLLAIAAAVFAVLSLSFLINWAMRWPEGDPDSQRFKVAKWRSRAWIWLRQRLG
jgi:hypothetical protein